MVQRSCFAILLAVCGGVATADEPVARWYKGNLHTHSLWSDGDEFPEMIAAWYRDQGYNFLALSDHNVLSEGVRWMSKKAIVGRSDQGIVDRYIARFGRVWVEQRENPTNGDPEVRLKPLDEFRSQVESAGEFIMIPGEEISDRAEGKPVHINATNLGEVIKPARGETVREAIANNLRIILQHEKDHGREVLPHLNHPNFGYAVTAQDLAAVTDERFFEVYNGHPSVNQLGDQSHPSVEAIWDQVNAIRLQAGVPPLLGIGTDDSHEYHGVKGSHPGRGWVMVKSRYLSPQHLIRAMKRGDFYASSGVELDSVTFDSEARQLSVDITAHEGVSFTTEFVTSTSEQTGVVVSTSTELSATYTMKPDELYVRARITSDQVHPDPSFPDQKQQAWTQPVGWQR